MWSVEDADLVEKHDCNTTTFALGDFSAKPSEECFDVFPGDVRAGRVCEDRFQGLLMRALHVQMVPNSGTDHNTGES